MDINQFLSLDHKKDNSQKDLIEGLIPKESIGFVAGNPGEGKSFLLQAAILHIAYGKPFLSKSVTPGNVMLIDNENTTDNKLQEKIQKLRNGIELDKDAKQLGKIDIQSRSNFQLDDLTTWEMVVERIGEIKPVIIGIDNLSKAHHQIENNTDKMKVVLEGAMHLHEICKSTIILIHHLNKKDSGSFYQRLRGAGILFASCDFAYEVRALVLDEDKRLRKFGIIPQARKVILIPPTRVSLLESAKGEIKEFVNLVSDGHYTPNKNIKLDRVAETLAHFFLGNPGDKEQTINDAKTALAGRSYDAEIREVFDYLVDIRFLEEGRFGRGGKLVYKMVGQTGKQKLCPWCKKTEGELFVGRII